MSTKEIQIVNSIIPHTNSVSENSSDKEYPTAKAVYNFVKEFVSNETDTQRSSNPKIWELDKGWHYITQGFYYGEGENDYVKLVGVAVIYKPYSANISCTYIGLGVVDSNKTNTICGDVMYVNNKWQGTCSIQHFTEKITVDNPLNHNYPSEKAVVNFVTSYVNAEKQIPVVQNPNLWELEDGWYYVDDGFYYTEENYVKLTPEALIYIYTNPYHNFYGWEMNGAKFVGSIEDTENGHQGYCKKQKLTTEINESSTDEQYPTAKSVFNYVAEQISDLVDTAPDTLNTLNELANALNNDENFASTVMEQIGKKVDKESIVTEVTNNSTDEQIASAKSVFDLIQSEKQFTSLSNPNLWELTNGLYEIVNGFYYNTNGGYYKLDTANYWMFVTKLETISGVICYIYRLGLLKYKITITSSNGVDFSGLISEYNRECTSISDTSTNYETPTTKAVYDFVQSAIQEALYIDEEETI